MQVVTVLRATKPLLGEAKWERLESPLVIDVDTGVVYGVSGLTRDLRPTRPLSFSSEGLALGEVQEGRVAACFVGSFPGDTDGSLSTRMWLE